MQHETTFTIRFFETDHSGCITPVALFNIMQEVAIQHGDAVGMTPAALDEAGYVWMMNRIHMQIGRLPKRGESLHVKTWAFHMTGMYATREWDMTAEDGSPVARATGRWIILDAPKRKIIRVPEHMGETYGVYPERAVEDTFERMHPLELHEHEREFHVRASDLDTNQHANSAAYMDWVLESVPPDMMEHAAPLSIELMYKKECKQGDALVARSQATENGVQTDRTYVHEVRNSDTGDVLCLGRTRWKLPGHVTAL